MSLALAAPAGQLTVKTGDLSVGMESRAGWTIRSVDYQGARLIIPAGGQGAVIMPKGGKWIGSAMGPEEPVSSFAVTADGKPVTLQLPQTVTGETVVVEKKSMLGNLEHSAETTFENDLLIQRHTFVAQDDTTLRSFYAFLYSIAPTTKSWLAKPLSGELARGTFANDKSHKPALPCLWLAQYDPAAQKGVLVYIPTPFADRGASTRFWDTKGYHKFLAQPLTGLIKKGTKLDYVLVMKFFSAEADAWEQTARKLAEELQTRFPAKEVAVKPAKRLYGKGVPETGIFTCKTDRYTVPFGADRAWTIRDIRCDGDQVSLANGFHGTVMIPKGSNWWGTGHTEGGREIVHSLKLTVDGQDRPVVAGETAVGHKITLIKDSTIWKFKANVEVTVTNDHVFERTQLTATEACELNRLYYFMHCFPPTTTEWMAKLPDGKLETGELSAAGNMAVSKDTRWVAQYEPNFGVALLCYTPKVISGPHSASMIWNKKNYHKYYLRQNNGQSFEAGEKLDYTVIVKVVRDETGDWSATKAAAAALAEEYPPVNER